MRTLAETILGRLAFSSGPGNTLVMPSPGGQGFQWFSLPRQNCSAILALLLLIAGSNYPLYAQAPSMSYEGQQVAQVELVARPGVDIGALEKQVVQKAGEPYSNQKVAATLEALRKTGQFTKVSLEVVPVVAGLQLLFLLHPVFYVGIVRFPGAEKIFPYARLLQVVDFPPQAPYRHSQIGKAKDNLVKFFAREGYFRARVQVETEANDTHELVNLKFEVTLNEKAKFGQVAIVGPPPREVLRLQGALRSIRAWVRGASVEPGENFSRDRLEAAQRYLQSYLADRHRLANSLDLQPPRYDPKTNRADITFDVTLGPLVHVEIKGARLSWLPFLGARRKRRLIPIYGEGSIDNDLIEEGERNLFNYFQTKGYFDADVDNVILREDSKVTVEYKVDKRTRHEVEEISVRGNRHLATGYLLSHVPLEGEGFLSPGRFDEKLLNKSVDNLTALYHDTGFEAVKIDPQVLDEGSNIFVTFEITEGPRSIVNSLDVKGNATVPLRALAPGGLNLQPGRPYSPRGLNEDRNQIVAKYLSLGYLSAWVDTGVSAHEGSPQDVDVVYTIHEGTQVHIASVVDLGAEHTKTSFIDRIVNIPAGNPLSQSTLLESESLLYSTGVFDWARIEPRRPVAGQQQEKEEVLVKVHEGRRNRLSYGIGFEAARKGGNVPGGTVVLPGGFPVVGLPKKFQTSEKTILGPRFSLEYSRLNMRGRGETASVGMLLSRLDQRGSLSYSDPRFRGSLWSSLLSFSAERTSENPIYTARTGQGSFQLEKALNEDKSKTLLFRYSYGRTVLTNLLIPELVPPQDRNVRLSTLSTSYVRDTRDNPLNAHRGIYQTADFGVTPQVFGASASFGRFFGQTAYYKPMGKSLVWANDVRLGLVKAFAGSSVPLSESFFSGGPNSLRGFPLNGAGPQRQVPVCSDPNVPSTCTQITVPVGGRELFIVNSELRFPMPMKKGLGGVFFYDGGNVYEHIGFSRFFTDYSNTLGFGLRYETPVGPIRFDVGRNLSPIPGIKATQFFITLGQAF